MKKELAETRESGATATTPVTPMVLLSMAVQQSEVSIERMEQLLSLQIRWEENEARKAYHQAVADFKTESINIIKDKQVGYHNSKGQFVGYSHATLGNIAQTIIPIMSKYGLSHYWAVKQEGEISVTCHLMHSMGHSTSVTMSAVKDDSGQKNLIQQVASTVTYLERYTLLAITGLAAQDQDDDAGGAGAGTGGKPAVSTPQAKQTQQTTDNRPVSEAQAKMLFAKCKNKGVSIEAFCAHYKIKELKDLPFSEMNPALKLIDSGEIPEPAASSSAGPETDEEPTICGNCGETIAPDGSGHLEGCNNEVV